MIKWIQKMAFYTGKYVICMEFWKICALCCDHITNYLKNDNLNKPVAVQCRQRKSRRRLCRHAASHLPAVSRQSFDLWCYCCCHYYGSYYNGLKEAAHRPQVYWNAGRCCSSPTLRNNHIEVTASYLQHYYGDHRHLRVCGNNVNDSSTTDLGDVYG